MQNRYNLIQGLEEWARGLKLGSLIGRFVEGAASQEHQEYLEKLRRHYDVPIEEMEKSYPEYRAPLEVRKLGEPILGIPSEDIPVNITAMPRVKVYGEEYYIDMVERRLIDVNNPNQQISWLEMSTQARKSYENVWKEEMERRLKNHTEPLKPEMMSIALLSRLPLSFNDM